MSLNPFEIKTPESNSAEDILDLFVDVFTDFHHVKEIGHTFLNGPRGSGKSMMFRYMMPDCQMLKNKCEANQLDYFSVYVGVKKTDINNAELERFSKNANLIINEHLLSTYVIANVFGSICQTFGKVLDAYTDEISSFFKDIFVKRIRQCGYNNEIDTNCINKGGLQLFIDMINIVDGMKHSCKRYCCLAALNKDQIQPYNDALTDFVDFVEPIIVGLKRVSLFPSHKPFFILIDDAGYLNLAQTKVLNTWVSYRTTKDICIKISTQLDYKTHLTANDRSIDSPHDYSEINISTIYSSRNSIYNSRIKEIVRKRIKKYLGLDIEPEAFFPVDTKQEEEISQLQILLKEKNANPLKPYAGKDAAQRYARPEYIKELQQKHKAGAQYSYAGFDQLVAISSGIIRHFLAPAQEMFAAMESLNPNKQVNYIKPGVQDKVIKKYSDDFLHNQCEDIRKDQGYDGSNLQKADKLYNLIDSLGALFHLILVSEAKERRVFSIAISDTPDRELYDILDLCEHFGYLHRRTIGNKQGTGKNTMYVLSRILAPHFKLDPTSFAGYKFTNSETLKTALTNKNQFLKQMMTGVSNEDFIQLTLFEGESND
ncbi:MAG: hypothetical protein MJY68_04630 [Bacteroidaceae bacterium]|nr:hypothetical protein [Bacteroidaceae bacterium]